MGREREEVYTERLWFVAYLRFVSIYVASDWAKSRGMPRPIRGDRVVSP
jgi:hypothetical protein